MMNVVHWGKLRHNGGTFVILAICMLFLSHCNKGGGKAPEGEPGQLGYSSSQEAADSIVKALVENDWQIFWEKMPSNSEIDSWTPHSRRPVSEMLPKIQEGFQKCALEYSGKKVKILKIQGGTNEGRKDNALRDDVGMCSDLEIEVQVEGMEKTGKIEFDNPLLVKGRLFPIFLDRCRFPRK